MAGLLIVLGGGTARSQELKVLTDQQLTELRAEARLQLTDARRVHRSDARTLGYSKAEIKHGETPSMVRKGMLEVKLPDGTRIEFPWYRVGFAENRYANTGKKMMAGPNAAETNKGGIRIHQGVFPQEVEALALKMDRKIRLSGDMLGGWAVRGAKGGIGPGRVVAVGSKHAETLKAGDHIDPASHGISRATLMRKFAEAYRKSGAQVGLGSDIQAGDVNTKQPEMMALARRYGRIAGSKIPSIGVSGKELVRTPTGTIDPRGGIEYRAVSTGEGVAMAANHAATGAGLTMRGATVVSQGWGEVGNAFGLALMRQDARVIAIEERWMVDGKVLTGVLAHPKGDRATIKEAASWVGQVQEYRQQWAEHMRNPQKPAPNLRTFQAGGLMSGFTEGKSVFFVKADIVGVNALGGTVDAKAVKNLLSSGTSQGKAKVYVEGANLAATAEGAAALDRARAKIIAVPGDLANLGGVHVSNIEAVQNATGRVVSNEAARRSLDNVIAKAWAEAQALAKEHSISVRAGVELLATSRMMKSSLQKSDATKIDIKQQLFPNEARAKPIKTQLAKNLFPTVTKASRQRVMRAKALRASGPSKAKAPTKTPTRAAARTPARAR